MNDQTYIDSWANPKHMIWVTEGQAKWLSWALDAMRELTDQEYEDLGFRLEDVPANPVDREFKFYPSSTAVLNDLLYRLEDQAEDLARSEREDFGKGVSAAPARKVAAMIRKVMEADQRKRSDQA